MMRNLATIPMWPRAGGATLPCMDPLSFRFSSAAPIRTDGGLGLYSFVRPWNIR